jgi:superfamily II DNA or RNA helicase
MQVEIGSLLKVQAAPEVIKEIKKDLTIKNPEFVKKLRMGLPMWGIPEKIELWKEEDGSLILPRGYFHKLWQYERLSFDKIQDNRVKLPEVEFPVMPKLRDYQSPSLQKAADWEQGVILMPCGAGKTHTGLSVIAQLKQPALWLTHTLDLLNQSKQRAEEAFGLSGNQIGVIQGENYNIGTHITFATVQTLTKRNLEDLVNKFGCIVIDECHLVFKDHAKSRQFESVISQFPAYYRFGLTASEFRSDGLIDTMFHVIGPKVYEITQEDLRDTDNVVTPKVEFILTEFQYIPDVNEDGDEERLNVQKMLLAMRMDSDRQRLLCNVLECDINEDDYCIVLGDSLEHLEGLKLFVESIRRTAAYINGKTPKKQREKIMADMRAGKYQYLFATYQLAKLGLDIPRLNTLVLATPKKDKTSIQQSVGRIMRPMEGKRPARVYDLWDKGVNCLKYWAYDRTRVYKKLGCEINNGPKVRK